MKRVLLALSFLPAFAAGCSAPSTVQTPTSSTSATTTQETVATTTASMPVAPAVTSTAPQIPKKVPSGAYVAYSQGVFEQAKQGHRPMLLFFYADNCPGCEQQDPVLAKLFSGPDAPDALALRIYYAGSGASADEKASAKAFGVRSPHTFIMLNAAGQEMARKVGAMSAEETRSLISKAL